MAFDNERTWAMRFLIISVSIGMVLFMLGITSSASAGSLPMVPDRNSSISVGTPATQTPVSEGQTLTTSIGLVISSLSNILLWQDFVWTQVLELPGSINIIAAITYIISIAALSGILSAFVSSLKGLLGG